jgi:hypothetical protein
VRIVRTDWGYGVETSDVFECWAGSKLTSYGKIKLVTDDQLKDSEWVDYAVYWSEDLSAVPAASYAEVKKGGEWGPSSLT